MSGMTLPRALDRRRVASASLVGVLVLLIAAPGLPGATATNIGNASYAPSWIGSYGWLQRSWRTTNDSFALYLNAKWDSTHRAGITQYYSKGWRYSQDWKDGVGVLPKSLNANGRFATTFENPVYDSDNNDNDSKEDEAEITAVSTAFPSVNSNYYADVQFSHWFRTCGSCSWQWDPDSAEVGYTSQISSNFLGRWVTEKFTWPPYRYVSTPYQPAPAGFSATNEFEEPSGGATGITPEQGAVGGGEFEVAGIRAVARQDDREVDVRIVPPDDLVAYIVENDLRISTLPEASTSLRVVITFAEPLPVNVVEEILDGRAALLSFEAVGRTRDRRILTIGGPDLPARLAEEFVVYDASSLGIVAVEVVVGSKIDLEALSRAPKVLLADVSKEVVSRNVPEWVLDLRRGGDLDLILNDVYWLHTGWDQ